jgi:hypothetical protein
MKSKSGPKRSQRRPPLETMVAIPHPPQIRPQLTHTQRLRFVVNTAGLLSITFQNLMDTMLVATSATVGYDVFDVVKVKFVEMWQERISSNSPISISCSFPGQSGAVAGDGKIVSDTALGIEPAHVFARPAKFAGASLWQGNNALVAFSLASQVGTVVDVCVVFKNAADVAPLGSQNALVGASAGQFYYRGLDGLGIATTKYTPQAQFTI